MEAPKPVSHSWRGRKHDVVCRHCKLVRAAVSGTYQWRYTSGSRSWLSYDAPQCPGPSPFKKKGRQGSFQKRPERSRVMKTVGSFQVKSLKDAGLTGGEWTGLVATSERFLVWGQRIRFGEEGFRRYCVKFSVSRRDQAPFELPVSVGSSDLKKILAHLEKLA